MMRHSVMLVATVVGLTACSDDLKPDLAACKAKTMELYKSADVSEAEPTGNACAPKGA
jgi:hypothetical protein